MNKKKFNPGFAEAALFNAGRQRAVEAPEPSADWKHNLMRDVRIASVKKSEEEAKELWWENLLFVCSWGMAVLALVFVICFSFGIADSTGDASQYFAGTDLYDAALYEVFDGGRSAS